MTTVSTPTTLDPYTAALADAIAAHVGSPSFTANEWSGIDARVGDATLRVAPIDGSWDYGANVYVFREYPSRMLVRRLTVDALAPATLADLATTLLGSVDNI